MSPALTRGFDKAFDGVTPAIDSQIVGEGSAYPWTAADGHDNPLDGGKSYKLHLLGPVPVRTFWSVIAYDTRRARCCRPTSRPRA